MTLADLVEWVDAAMARLETSRKTRERVKHVRNRLRSLRRAVRVHEVRVSEAALESYAKIRRRKAAGTSTAG